MNLKCNLSRPCHGALLLCFPFAQCGPGRTTGGAGGRLAASDFTISADRTAPVRIALTPLGAAVGRLRSGYPGDVIVDLESYGIVAARSAAAGFSTTSMSHVSLRITSADRGPGIPGGPNSSCGGAPPLFAGAGTSCALARAVSLAWQQGGRPRRVTVPGSRTGRSGTLSCGGSSPVVCAGQGLSVVFYA